MTAEQEYNFALYLHNQMQKECREQLIKPLTWPPDGGFVVVDPRLKEILRSHFTVLPHGT